MREILALPDGRTRQSGFAAHGASLDGGSAAPVATGAACIPVTRQCGMGHAEPLVGRRMLKKVRGEQPACELGPTTDLL